eukprot:CAMPEP_0201574362 /NCGR_PEP_ID=MMETSP0190_2-20130828/18799_1 /ASSEMBLY_ACC=CAM_ASM_000263 /TAXON_ID=37353 /ORGANISM="Rosalina sp." /LENGTH=476 /DNA_ID=CAMNT_0048002501 /DNA_START=78 /DNA_END=1508 /DNA_ORIENTATION=+
MKSIVALLLAVPLIWAEDEDARVCYRGAARVAVDPVDREVVAFAAKGREQTCYSSESGCGAVRKFGVSRQWDPETRSFLADETVAWSTLDLGCVRPGICDAITGDENGACRYAIYSYPRYEAMSCNATRGYDAEIFLQTVKLYYGCCQGTDKCVDPSRDSAGNEESDLEATCTENEALGDYIQDLQTCWQVGSEIFRRYFACNEGGMGLFDYKGACMDENGEWDRDLAASDRDATACYYRRTCTPALIGLIKTFSQCACTAAKTNGFSGRAIGQFMESNWNRWCPGIELSCDADREYAPYVRRRLRRRKIKFRIKRKIADLTDAQREAIRTAACNNLLRRQCPSTTDDDEETVTVTATAASDDGRRRLVDVDSENYSDIVVDIYGDEAFDDAIETVACSSSAILEALGTDLSGGEATSLSCDSDDEYIEEEGTDPDATTTAMPDEDTTVATEPTSGAFMIGNGFAFIMAVFGYIMQ